MRLLTLLLPLALFGCTSSTPPDASFLGSGEDLAMSSTSNDLATSGSSDLAQTGVASDLSASGANDLALSTMGKVTLKGEAPTQ